MKRLLVLASVLVFFVSCSGPPALNVEQNDLKNKGLKKITLQSSEKYVCCDLVKEAQLFVNRDEAKEWETFRLHEMSDGKVALQASNDKYVTYDPDNKDQLFANSDSIVDRAIFLMISIKDDQYCFKASNGRYVSGDLSMDSKLVANREEPKEWETFKMKVIK